MRALASCSIARRGGQSPLACNPSRSTLRTLATLAAIALLVTGCAGTPVATPASRPPGFDWRASPGVAFRIEPAAAEAAVGQSEQQPSYILGTYHSANAAELGLDLEHVQSLVASSRVLVTEVAAGSTLDEASAARRHLDAGMRLSALLGKDAFGQLATELPGIDPDFLDRAKPWVVVALLESGDSMPETPIDAVVEGWAARAGLRTMHLETLDQQVAALDCLPAAEQGQVLRDRLDGGWSFADESTRALRYYRSGDLVGWLQEIRSMAGLGVKARDAESRAWQCLIDDRNRLWLPRLLPLLHEGGGFVAIGGLHLTGESGLLQQLSERGFRITPVQVQPVNGLTR